MQPEEFAKNLTALWSKPRETADGTRAMGQYIEALAKFTPPQLDAGWANLRDTHERSSWPLVSEVRKAILSAVGANRPKREEKQDHSDFANSSMCSTTAQNARSHGWLLCLWDFCREAGRMPTSREIGELREVADRVNAAAARLNPSDKLDGPLLKIWEAMMAREAKLSALVPDVATYPT